MAGNESLVRLIFLTLQLLPHSRAQPDIVKTKRKKNKNKSKTNPNCIPRTRSHVDRIIESHIANKPSNGTHIDNDVNESSSHANTTLKEQKARYMPSPRSANSSYALSGRRSLSDTNLRAKFLAEATKQKRYETSKERAMKEEAFGLL